MTKASRFVIITINVFMSFHGKEIKPQNDKGRYIMEIALIAEDNKKELMAQFCIAYFGTLKEHHLYATDVTGRYVSDATGLDIETFLTGSSGGIEQIAAKISYNEVDLVFYFRSTDVDREHSEHEDDLIRLCDVHNIPLATNIATAETLIMALGNGDLNWRNIINPRSEHNMKRRGVLF